MYGTTARVTLNTPVTLVSSTSCTSSSSKAGERIVADRAGVVDEHVDAAAALGDALDGGRAGRGVADVDLLGGDLRARGARGGDDRLARPRRCSR